VISTTLPPAVMVALREALALFEDTE
jgi:7-keto-8-aminopelargonate synthetase-like enzyme